LCIPSSSSARAQGADVYTESNGDGSEELDQGDLDEGSADSHFSSPSRRRGLTNNLDQSVDKSNR
jgi:hypothetical protein